MKYSPERTAVKAAEVRLPPLPGGWLVVAMLSVVGALNYLDRTMITTMRESLIKEIPMSDGQFALLTSAFLWVYGALSPFAGFLADYFSRSHVIIFSLFAWSACTWLTACAVTFEQLLATRVLMGISEACYIPAALALIVDYHRGSTRSLASGLHIAGIMTGQSLGFIGGWLAEKSSWTAPFSLFGGIGIAYALGLLLWLKDPPAVPEFPETPDKTRVSFPNAVKELFRRKRFILLVLFWSLLGIAGWVVAGWAPTFYQDRFNLSQGIAGFYATAYLYPVSIVGVVLGGYLTDRWSRTRKNARFLVPLIGLAIAAPSIFFAGGSHTLLLTIFLFMAYSLTRMFSDANIMPILCLITDSRYRATAYGVLNLFACVIGGIGLYAGGVLRDLDIDLERIFKCTGLLVAFCIILLIRIQRTISNEDIHEDH